MVRGGLFCSRREAESPAKYVSPSRARARARARGGGGVQERELKAAHNAFGQNAVKWLSVREFATTAACVAALRDDGRVLWASTTATDAPAAPLRRHSPPGSSGSAVMAMVATLGEGETTPPPPSSAKQRRGGDGGDGGRPSLWLRRWLLPMVTAVAPPYGYGGGPSLWAKRRFCCRSASCRRRVADSATRQTARSRGTSDTRGLLLLSLVVKEGNRHHDTACPQPPPSRQVTDLSQEAHPLSSDAAFGDAAGCEVPPRLAIVFGSEARLSSRRVASSRRGVAAPPRRARAGAGARDNDGRARATARAPHLSRSIVGGSHLRSLEREGGHTCGCVARRRRSRGAWRAARCGRAEGGGRERRVPRGRRPPRLPAAPRLRGRSQQRSSRRERSLRKERATASRWWHSCAARGAWRPRVPFLSEWVSQDPNP